MIADDRKHEQHRLIWVWPAFACLLLVLQSPFLGEKYYWDGVGCYLVQADYFLRLGRHFFDPNVLVGVPPYVRTPLFSSVMALVLRLCGDRPAALQAVVVLWTALLPAATWVLTRQLGGNRKTAAFAALLCILNPSFFAQAHLIQGDLAAAAFATCAFVLLLDGKDAGFALLAALAVLTKESTYFLCVPAFLWLLARERLTQQALPPRRVFTLWLLAAVPGFALIGWMFLHHHLTHYFIHPDHTALFGLATVGGALLHAFAEYGRLALMLLVTPFAWPHFLRVLRGICDGKRAFSQSDAQIGSTFFLATTLPFLFPLGLVRYMLPALGALCALAALATAELRPALRRAVQIGLPLFLVLNWWGASWHENPAYHREANLEYRRVLDLQVAALQVTAQAAPATALTAFPLLQMGGHLDLPRRGVAIIDEAAFRARPCAASLLLRSNLDTLGPLYDELAAAHRLTLQQEWSLPPSVLTPKWAKSPIWVRLYQVDCRP